MNRQQFSEFVKNPGITNAQSIKMLEEVIKRYPYCQAGQLLYTYNLYREENLQYPVQLKKAAAYAGDRRMLRELIESARKKSTPDVNSSLVAAVSGFPVESQPKSSEIIHSTPDLTSVTTELQITPNVTDERKESSEKNYPEIFGAITQEELAAFQALPYETNHSAGLSDETATSSSNEEDLVPVTIQAGTRMTHEELLAIVKRRLAEINAEKHQEISVPKTLLHPEYGLQYFSSDRSALLSPKTKESIIDKFISEEPKISKPKAVFFNPSDSAVRSNFDDEEIVSETLAKLYAAQGNISKAVHIYQKLSLLNQEKSRYFAAQIENLKS